MAVQSPEVKKLRHLPLPPLLGRQAQLLTMRNRAKGELGCQRSDGQVVGGACIFNMTMMPMFRS